MRALRGFMVLVLTLAVMGLPPESSSEEALPQAVKEVLAIEEEVWKALQQKNLDAVVKHLDEQYTGFESEVPKRFDSAAEHLQYQKEQGKELTIDWWKILKPRGQIYNDTVVLTYFAQDAGTAGGRPYHHLWKVTAVYVKAKEGWKIAHYHWSIDSSQ